VLDRVASVDAAVLRLLVYNPVGMFVAGDTAQAINRGASFRFSELTSAFYRAERTNALLAATAGDGDEGPSMHQLVVYVFAQSFWL